APGGRRPAAGAGARAGARAAAAEGLARSGGDLLAHLKGAPLLHQQLRHGVARRGNADGAKRGAGADALEVELGDALAEAAAGEGARVNRGPGASAGAQAERDASLRVRAAPGASARAPVSGDGRVAAG